MKKLLIMVATLAMFASCSKNEVIESSSNTGTEINFSNIYDRTTKAANAVTGDYCMVLARQDYDGSGDYNGAWFIKDALNDDATSGVATIISGNKYYWPMSSTSTIEFLAFAPSPYTTLVYNTDGSIDETNSTPSANFLPAGEVSYNINGQDVTLYGNQASEDIEKGEVIFTFISVDGNAELTASSSGTKYTNTQAGTNVPLNFIHLLAKIDIKLSLSEDLQKLGLTIEAGEASVVAAARRGIYTLGIDQEAYTDKWGVEENSFYKIEYPSSLNSLAFPNQDCFSAEDETTNIVPQEASGCAINIENVVILNSDGEVYYDQNSSSVNEQGQASAKSLSYTFRTAAENQELYGDTATYDVVTTSSDEQVVNNWFLEGYQYNINIVLGGEDLFGNEIIFETSHDSFVNAVTVGGETTITVQY